MKNIYYTLLLSFAVSISYAQTQTINTQLKLANVPQGAASDSILVRGADRIIKFVKKSDLLSSSTSDASATVRGFVNNLPLQELGGADKRINGVRIGRGNGNIQGNIALGTNALANNTTGNFNVAVGDSTLAANTTSSSNTAVGSFAYIILITQVIQDL